MDIETPSTSLLEGTQNVPQAIHVHRLLAARATEIKNLQIFLTKSSSTKLVFQRLPIHMRRRTMSHNVKRLPRRVRQAHLRQMSKSGLPSVQKKSSRSFRRRPRNLLLDYNRRQRRFTWLETHIWHAKRFHMTNRWGYRLPERPCDKAFRACYRASAKHCLLQDISYMGLIELSGPLNFLIQNLNLLTSEKTGLPFGAKAFISGNREGQIMLYHQNSYPSKAIGSVKFMWKPVSELKAERCLWLWIHAAYYKEVSECLINLFKLRIIQTFAPCEPTYMNNSNHVRLKEFKTYFNRFRLSGPLAHSVVKNSLKLGTENNTSPWFQEYLTKNKSNFEQQNSFWNTLQNIKCASEIPPHLIYNLVISDPRYNFPPKRTKAVIEDTELEFIDTIPEDLKFGTIWEHHFRTESSRNILSTTEIILRQRSKLVPETSAPEDCAVVPVMLVQQPGNRGKNLGYCSGWDIITPLNWGRPLWFSLIMRGARAGGIREANNILFEQGLENIIQPDTQAGMEEETRVSKEYTDKFFRLPPNKRVNYIKLGIECPFSHPWLKLLNEWLPNSADKFYIVRDKVVLQNIQKLLNNTNEKVSVNFKKPCLVPIKISHIKRGTSKRFSIICLPEQNDLRTNSEPVEHLHVDQHQNTRKQLRTEHQKELRKLRRKRIRKREAGKEVKNTEEMVAKYSQIMRSLWLPDPENVKNFCSRETFGFVTQGDFSFTNAKGQSIGYIVLRALPKLLHRNGKKKNLVLVRDTNSRQYRFATIEVIY